MSWARGRGRGRGGSVYTDAKYEVPFEIFPEIKLPDPKLIVKEPQLVTSYFNFQKFWKNSPYHLGDGVKKQENESLDIERFSDSLKPKNKCNKKGSFYDFLVLRPDNFPKDLLGDTRRERPVKKAKWTQNTDLEKLNVFDRLIECEAKTKAEGGDENKDREKEDETDNEDETDKEDESEDSDADDYLKQEFDDDDDDYNQEDDGDDDKELL